MHPYRTQTCGELRAAHVGQTARLAGWIHRKRDHGNLLFVDLRDHYGLTQVVATSGTPAFAELEGLRLESVVSVTGKVLKRSAETINADLPSGEIELSAESVELLSKPHDSLPLQVNSDTDYGEDTRLR